MEQKEARLEAADVSAADQLHRQQEQGGGGGSSLQQPFQPPAVRWVPDASLLSSSSTAVGQLHIQLDHCSGVQPGQQVSSAGHHQGPDPFCDPAHQQHRRQQLGLQQPPRPAGGRAPTPDASLTGDDQPLILQQPLRQHSLSTQPQRMQLPGITTRPVVPWGDVQLPPGVAAPGDVHKRVPLSTHSSGSWPDMGLDASLRAPEGMLLMQPGHTGPEPQQGLDDSGGEADAGMLWPGTGELHSSNSCGLLMQHMGQANAAAQEQLSPLASPVLPGTQQQQLQHQQPSVDVVAYMGEQLARQRRQQHQQLQQQPYDDAQLMPPPPMRGNSPSAAAAAAADRPAGSRPPRLEIPSSSGMVSQPQSAVSYSQQQHQHQQPLPGHQHRQQQLQQQQLVGLPSYWVERPASAPTPSPAPMSSTTVTPCLLSMGLGDTSAWATAAAGDAGLPDATDGFNAGFIGGAGSGANTGSSGSGSGSERQRRMRRRGSVPSSPAATPAAAAAGGGALGYDSAGRLLAAGSSPAAAGMHQQQQQQQQGVAGGVCAAAAEAMQAAGRRYVQVQCGTQPGWLDVSDSMVVVDCGTQDERKVTPPRFEQLAGKAAKKWRSTITALPDGPGDPWVPQAMPVGDFIRRVNLEYSAARDTSSSAAGHQHQQQAADAAAAAAAAGVFSPQMYALVSPGQRRRRSEDGSEVQRPLSAELHSGSTEDDSLGAAAAKRVRSSQDNPDRLQGGQQQEPSQQHQQPEEEQQQQQQPYAMDLPLGLQHQLAGDASAHAGLSISAAGPMGGLSWQPYGLMPGSVAGSSQGDSGMQSSQGGTASQRRNGREQGTSPGGFVLMPDQPCTLQHQSQQQQSFEGASQGWEKADQPAFLSLTPPDQLVAALQQQQPAAAGAARGGSTSAHSAKGVRRTPSSSPAVAAVYSASSDTSSQGRQQQQQQHRQAGKVTSRRAGSEDASQQEQEQQQSHSQEQLFSPAGRPLRQMSRRNAATAAAERYERLDRDSVPLSYAGGVRYLQVWCDTLPGNLDLHRMVVIPQSGEREGQPMSLSQFEILGGRGSARKWRRSVSVEDCGQVISLGEWLEKHQDAPGGDSGGVPCYQRASFKQRSSPPQPPAVGAAGAAAAAGGAGVATSGGKGQRDQGSGRAAAYQPSPHQHQKVGATSTTAAAPAGGPQPPHQLQQQQQRSKRKSASGLPPVPSPAAPPHPRSQRTPRGSPTLAAAMAAVSPMVPTTSGSAPSGGQLQLAAAYAGLPSPVQAAHQGAAVAAAAAAGVQNDTDMEYTAALPAVPQAPALAALHMSGKGPCIPGSTSATAAAAHGYGAGSSGLLAAPPPVAAAAAAAVAAGAAPLPPAGSAAAAAASLLGDPGATTDFWTLLSELASDPGHLELHLHPAQVEMDMADNTRDHQQLLVLESPPGGSTAAGAAGVVQLGCSNLLASPPAAARAVAAEPQHQQHHDHHHQQQQQPHD